MFLITNNIKADVIELGQIQYEDTEMNNDNIIKELNDISNRMNRLIESDGKICRKKQRCI